MAEKKREGMGKRKKIEIEGVNEVYKHVLNSDARIIVCYGGRDSGKSYFVGGQYIPHLICGEGYFRGAAIRKVGATHRDSCLQEVLDGIDMIAEQEDEQREARAKKARQYAKAEATKKLNKWVEQRVRRAAEMTQKAGELNGKDGQGGRAEDAIKALKKKAAHAVDEKGILGKYMRRYGADETGSAEGARHTVSPMQINHANGNRMIFKGLDEPRKLKSLKGLNFVWVEEAEDLKRQEFFDLIMLLRAGDWQQIVLTFNPVDEAHFSNGMFVECPADEVLETFDNGEKKVWVKYLDAALDGKAHRTKALVLRTTYEDNAYITPERKAAIEQLKNSDPYLYDVYRYGKFGTRGGRILINIEETDFAKAGLKFTDYDNRGYAQDFGFNHANCILALAEKDECLYVFEELYGQGKDTAEWIAEADRRGLDRRLLMVCDSAEPDRIKTWQRAGYRAVGVKKHAGSVAAQIDRLKRYKKIYINSACANTLREAREWKWKQKDGRFVDVPEDINDDCMAALRYGNDLFGDRANSAGMRNLGRR